MRHWPMPVRVVVLFLATLSASSRVSALSAQVISGMVTDSLGAPIGGAAVSVAAGSSSATTDENGHFQLRGVGAGPLKLSVRRLGFSPITSEISVSPGQSIRDLRLRMSANRLLLNPVVVSARRSVYTGRLAGYYQRLERRSGGYFISRDEIDKKSYRNLSQLLRAIPGINAFPLLAGGSTVRMRERKCRPLVWLDGVPMPAGEVDLDAFPVSTLHGIEAYPGSSNTPQDFVSDGLQGCGTIVLWSRGPDTDPVRQRQKDPMDLGQMIDAQKIFSADNVDERATVLDAGSLAAAYPPELITQRLSGSVLLQFVVDTTGRVEPETISVVSSTHALFSASASLAVRNASYHPAMKAGKPVRQVILQPFEFTPAGERTTEGSQPDIKHGG